MVRCVPEDVVTLLDRYGIVMMAARSGDLGLVEYVVEEFEVRRLGRWMLDLVKGFRRGFSVEVVEFLRRREGFEDGKVLEMAMRFGNVDCFEAFWDGSVLVDPWERWLTLSFNAVVNMRVPTSKSDLVGLPACRLVKGLIGGLEQTYLVLLDAYLRVLEFLTNQKPKATNKKPKALPRESVIAYVRFLSRGVSGVSKVALAAAVFKTFDRVPDQLKELVNFSMDPEASNAFDAFLDNVINKSTSDLGRLCGSVLFDKVCEDRLRSRRVRLAVLARDRYADALWRRHLWDCERVPFLFENPDEALEGAKRAVARRDLAQLIRCVLDRNLDRKELARWMVSREDRESVGVNLVLVVLGCVGDELEDLEVVRDLFAMLFEVEEEAFDRGWRSSKSWDELVESGWRCYPLDSYTGLARKVGPLLGVEMRDCIAGFFAYGTYANSRLFY
ncbi:hypothetical protein HDU97_007945 [Phlyctochytrium planicorne]|nr:hypothetical protein HDU97_007945 [Phlyctochytrium planicorne]